MIMKKMITLSTALLGALAIGGSAITASADTAPAPQRQEQQRNKQNDNQKPAKQDDNQQATASSSLQDSDLKTTTLSACTVKSDWASGTATPGSVITIKTKSGHVAGTAYASSVLGVWWTSLDTKYESGTQFNVTVSKTGWNSLTRTIEINS